MALGIEHLERNVQMIGKTGQPVVCVSTYIDKMGTYQANTSVPASDPVPVCD
jgi:hypothetical protein